MCVDHYSDAIFSSDCFSPQNFHSLLMITLIKPFVSHFLLLSPTFIEMLTSSLQCC